jgi:hypothetical protein
MCMTSSSLDDQPPALVNPDHMSLMTNIPSALYAFIRGYTTAMSKISALKWKVAGVGEDGKPEYIMPEPNNDQIDGIIAE